MTPQQFNELKTILYAIAWLLFCIGAFTLNLCYQISQLIKAT